MHTAPVARKSLSETIQAMLLFFFKLVWNSWYLFCIGGFLLAIVTQGLGGLATSMPAARQYLRSYDLSPQTYAARPQYTPPRPTARPPAAVRAASFTRVTGISSSRLIALLATADTDRSESLSWPEVRAFQRKLYRDFRYRANPIALRPDQFLAQGGGDCEDWALVTAALCRYWGWPAEIASLRGPDDQHHAICLIRVGGEKPAWAAHLFWRSEGGRVRWLVPVDYDKVGDLSDAAGPDWVWESSWLPESIYGWEM